MIFVLTIIGFGYYEQIEMPDYATCRVYQAVNGGKCEWVKHVAA